MSTVESIYVGKRDSDVRVADLRMAVFTTRNMVFLLAVLAMNYTLMRPSPVDLLYITAMAITLLHVALFASREVTRRAVTLAILLGAWAVSFTVASLPHLSEPFVTFELLAKTFAIAIGVIGAFVSMTWNGRHFETFMKVYIVSCVIASILGTIGFLLQTELLTWDGRAKGFIDDPNMYGSFLIPAVLFCAYFFFRPGINKVLLVGAMLVLLLGIVLSFSRIALVATLICLLAYVFFHNRRRPQRLIAVVGSLVAIGVIIFAVASLASPEFSEKLLDRLTFAKSYDLGEEGRYGRYLLVLPMILQNPIGVGVLQLEKLFPEPIHNIWLSSFVNYGWLAGFTWIALAISSVVVAVRSYQQTRSDIAIVLLISLVGIVLCASLHEGEHWRHLWLSFGLVWGFNAFSIGSDTRPAATIRESGPRQPRSPSPEALRTRRSAEARPASATPVRGSRLVQQTVGKHRGISGEARRLPVRKIGVGVRPDPGR